MGDQRPEYASLRKAQEILGLSDHALRILVARGEVPVRRIGRTAWVSLDAVRRAMAETGEANEPEPSREQRARRA